jgi:hypothetical protein
LSYCERWSVLVNVVVSDLFPLRDRGLYLTIFSVFWDVWSTVRSLLGGVMTTKLK